MNLKNAYSTILQETEKMDIAQEIKNLTRADLQLKENWYKGLALLDHASSDLGENKDEVFAFYKKLVTEGLDFKASVYLNEEDYGTHLNILLAALEKLAVYFPIIYTQIAFQYREARRSHRDAEKIIYYLDKAIDQKVELGLAVKGYFLYYGVLIKEDKEAGLELLNSSSSLWVKLYKAYISLNTGDTEGILPLIAELKESEDFFLIKSAFVLEGNYYDSIRDEAAATAVYQTLYQNYEHDYALFRLATMKFASSEDPTVRSEAFAMWKEAFELGTVEAAIHLGYHALPENNGGSSFDEAIHWFELGYLYNNAFAAYRLALIYLYVPEFINGEKGLHYLDVAIADGSADALIEKAEVLLDGAVVKKDEQAGLELLRKAAEDKLPYAMNRLGYFYEEGLLVGDADVEKALSYYEQAAELNFPAGINNSGRIYRYGVAGEPDQEKARAYFEKGVELGFPYAMTELAFMYEDGTIVKDLQQSFDLFKRAAEMDYAFAIHATGTYLENAYHMESPDHEAAFNWYKRGAELNDVNCTFETGRCYRFGIGVQEDPDQAIAYYEQAAEGGNPKAMVELGLCYEHEYGVAFDAQKAFDYMQSAAKQNYYYGAYKLGYYYMHGLITQDSEKGLEWFHKAAETGYPHAMIEIGDYYMYDYDRIDQAEKAFDYYQQAFERDVLHEGLGLCYEYGLGVETNYPEAFKYYEMAANREYILAMYHTGRCYLNGSGVKANPEQAFRWFNDAAQHNNIASQYYTGTLLLNGKGVAMNKEEGLQWLNKAAEENYALAQFELGNCYLMGDGVEEDEEMAMSWFEKAADNGHEKAMKLTGRKKGK